MAQFINQAQLRYGNSVTNSNIAIGEILEVLSVTKTAVNASYLPDGNVTYIVSIVNAGAAAITGLTLTDDLGTYPLGNVSLTPLTYLADTLKVYSNGTLQAAPAVTAGPPLCITGLTVPAGGNLLLVYEASVNSYAPLSAEETITNTVTVTGTTISSITAQETVTVAAAPLLTITKSISPVPVTENGTLTYTFVIQNDGNTAADAAAGIVITDQFDPILRSLTVTYNGTTLVQNTDYTYNETTGEFATIAGSITVPAATFTRNPNTDEWMINPGSSTLIVTGTI